MKKIILIFLFFITGCIYQKPIELSKTQFKVTLDFIDTPSGQFLRLVDCHTRVLCFSNGQNFSCVYLSQISNEFGEIMKARCQ